MRRLQGADKITAQVSSPKQTCYLHHVGIFKRFEEEKKNPNCLGWQLHICLRPFGNVKSYLLAIMAPPRSRRLCYLFRS